MVSQTWLRISRKFLTLDKCGHLAKIRTLSKIMNTNFSNIEIMFHIIGQRACVYFLEIFLIKDPIQQVHDFFLLLLLPANYMILIFAKFNIRDFLDPRNLLRAFFA